jgi:RimJ/RimL family protein N-acetyltransferase
MRFFETERLTLRWFTSDDAAFIFELVNEPGWKRFIGDRGIDSLNRARDYIDDALLSSYARHGFGLYAIERSSDGVLVGMCGLLKRDTLDDVDIGFALLAQYEGNGYALEAAIGVLDFARTRLGLRRVVAVTKLDNERSGRLLSAAGMSRARKIQLGGEDLWLYSMTL